MSTTEPTASAGPTASTGHTSPAATHRRFNTTACLMASVWLVILVIPVLLLVTDSLDGHIATWRAVGGIALIVAFGAVYAVTFGVLEHTPGGLTPRGRFLFWLAPLALVTVATGVVGGMVASYLVPFLVAYFAFILPRPAASARCW